MKKLYALLIHGRTWLSTDITEINSLAIKNALLGHVDAIGEVKVDIKLSVIAPVLRCDNCSTAFDTPKKVAAGTKGPIIDTCPICGSHNLTDVKP